MYFFPMFTVTVFSLQKYNKASPIYHLALEKSITDLSKGDFFEICFIF